MKTESISWSDRVSVSRVLRAIMRSTSVDYVGLLKGHHHADMWRRLLLFLWVRAKHNMLERIHGWIAIMRRKSAIPT
jgi:hypothetical protein